MEELFAGREILPDIHISDKLFNLVPLVIMSRDLPQGYCCHLRMGGYRLQTRVHVCVCVLCLCVFCVCTCVCVCACVCACVCNI